MTTFTTKKGSLLEPLDLALTNKDGVAIDLTLAQSATLFVRNPATDTLMVSGAALEIIAPATGGIVRYMWDGADVAAPGLYFAEVKLTWTSGKAQYIPADGYVVVEIQENLET